MNILFFLKPKVETSYVYNDYTLAQALETLRACGFTAIPVINRAGEYVGALSEGDLLWTIVDHHVACESGLARCTVDEALRRRTPAPVNVNASIEDLLLLAMNQNFIPVTDDRGLFIGIVTRRDILQYFYDRAM